MPDAGTEPTTIPQTTASVTQPQAQPPAAAWQFTWALVVVFALAVVLVADLVRGLPLRDGARRVLESDALVVGWLGLCFGLVLGVWQGAASAIFHGVAGAALALFLLALLRRMRWRG